MWPEDQKVFCTYGESLVNPIICPDILMLTNYPWNKIVRRDYLKNIALDFGSARMQEDIYLHWQILTQATRVRFFMRHFYRYTVDDHGHITNDMSNKRFGVYEVFKQTNIFLDTLPSKHIFKPYFFRFVRQVILWIWGAIPSELAMEMRYYEKEFFTSLAQNDLPYIIAAGDEVINYFYEVVNAK